MASNRHLGRIIALQTLYEQDFRREAGDDSFDLDTVLTRNIERYLKLVDDRAFIEALVRGVASKEKDLDAQLQPIAPEWPIDQIARMDRVVLRIGLYELLFNKDVPPKVVINEAVELAKSFGGENSSKFVNGVLGTALRQIDPQIGSKAVEESDEAADEEPAGKATKPAKAKATKTKETTATAGAVGTVASDAETEAKFQADTEKAA
jgi:N utilization substance protein B